MQKISIHNQGLKKHYKTAFSLLELSVVMVIIGFLIFAITAGNSLVRSAKFSKAKSLTISSQITTIPGMVLWAESSMQDSFANGQGINGAQVSQWLNREPSGYLTKNNLTATASVNVLYREKSINDLPALNMTASGKLALANFSGSSSLSTSTVIIVFRPTTAPSGTTTVLADSGTSPTCSIGITNNQVVLNAGSAASTGTATNSASFIQNGSYILLVNFNGANSKAFVNNVNTEAGAAVINPGNNALNGFTIGTSIAAEIPEVIIYNRVLKDSERRDVMNYLSKKYKITVTGLQ